MFLTTFFDLILFIIKIKNNNYNISVYVVAYFVVFIKPSLT
jgi:hypothetical protein